MCGGQPGVISQFYGFHDVQDHLPPGTEAPPGTGVRGALLRPQTLWGEAAEPNGALYLDMWERYLEPNPERGGES